ncbi:pentapeptide repeat-containing protein [Streptomyces sp. IBSBF 2435]|uniref:pentapeptide repeat-containing protein n=1 Tax=Streptomyces sp. IBSBF 2435 TaxID=2903531 RepID=UPI002FDBD28E
MRRLFRHRDGDQRLWPVGPVLAASFAVALATAASVFYTAWKLLGAHGLKHEPRLDSDTLFDLVKLSFGVVAGAGALVALIVSYRKQRVDEAAGDRDRTRLYDERFTTASNQLGDNSAAVRLAAVHTLARLADDARELRQTCIDILCAYLRLPYTPETDIPPDDRPAHHQYSADREVRHTTIRLIRDHLRPTPDSDQPHWHGHTFDFTGVAFDGGDFSRARFTGGTVSFTGTRFTGGTVDFTAAQFTGGTVDFTGARFTGGTVDFTAAQFASDNVTFVASRFEGGTVNFAAAQFEGSTTKFRMARFEAGTVHFGAHFTGGTVDFRNAQFEGGLVAFSAARFTCAVDFTAALFQGGRVLFSPLQINGATLNFTAAQFTGSHTNFTGVRFEGGTVHFGAHFANAIVDFTRAQFEGSTVNFTAAQFEGSTLDFRHSQGVRPDGLIEPGGSVPLGVKLPPLWQLAP